jgi:glycosyltransferase involved in cell wall biosynthesis
MFVHNACTTDIRVLREADTLSRAGWNTTIVALQTGGKPPPPDQEVRGDVRIVRVRAPKDWRKRWHVLRNYPWRVLRGVPGTVIRSVRGGRAGSDHAMRLTAMAFVTLPYSTVQALRYFIGGHRPVEKPPDHRDPWDHLAWWRLSLLGWADAAAAAAPPADVYHGHDLTGLPAAAAAARRHPRAVVVYDSHEIFLEAGLEARQPWWVRRLLGHYERGLIRSVTAIITVNRLVGAELHRRYGGPPPTVVHNAPPRQRAGPTRPDQLRVSAGIAASSPVVLYHGGFQQERGLEILAEAMLDDRLRSAHLVLLGFGALEAQLRELAAETRFDGRVHVIAAVPPEDLLALVASANVSAMPIQPTTLNHRLSTPNKLFESLAVGTPVVASDMPGMASIIRETGCGVLVDPTRPEAVASGLAELLSLDADEMAALRDRCLRAAHEQYNWETESALLLGVYERIGKGRLSK